MLDPPLTEVIKNFNQKKINFHKFEIKEKKELNKKEINMTIKKN